MPARSSDSAMACLRRSRGSTRYTRTFVSTSAATRVDLLASPSAPRPGAAPSRVVPLARPLATRRRIEDPQTFSDVVRGGRLELDPNAVARGDELDLVPGHDAEAIGHRLRNGHLELARHFRHF